MARITLKTIDYFKFKKLVIDGIRDDFNACGKDVKALCDCVQTLSSRDEEFQDPEDDARLLEICSAYRTILAGKRIDAADVRIKSGWWGDHKNTYSAGKIKITELRSTLLTKAKEYARRDGKTEKYCAGLESAFDGPGFYILKHKEKHCFQMIGRSDRVFPDVAETFKRAFDGAGQCGLLSGLLVISYFGDWDFCILPFKPNEDERVWRVQENDLLLQHDSIWPYGLNKKLHVDSLLEVAELRRSCIRHHWPPDRGHDFLGPLNLAELRSNLITSPCGTEKTLQKQREPSPEVINVKNELNCRRAPSPKTYDRVDAYLESVAQCSPERPPSVHSVALTHTITADHSDSDGSVASAGTYVVKESGTSSRRPLSRNGQYRSAQAARNTKGASSTFSSSPRRSESGLDESGSGGVRPHSSPRKARPGNLPLLNSTSGPRVSHKNFAKTRSVQQRM